jgi:hypothetical protein
MKFDPNEPLLPQLKDAYRGPKLLHNPDVAVFEELARRIDAIEANLTYNIDMNDFREMLFGNEDPDCSKCNMLCTCKDESKFGSSDWCPLR